MKLSNGRRAEVSRARSGVADCFLVVFLQPKGVFIFIASVDIGLSEINLIIAC
jgi:hypothetical protein